MRRDRSIVILLIGMVFGGCSVYQNLSYDEDGGGGKTNEPPADSATSERQVEAETDVDATGDNRDSSVRQEAGLDSAATFDANRDSGQSGTGATSGAGGGRGGNGGTATGSQGGYEAGGAGIGGSVVSGSGGTSGTGGTGGAGGAGGSAGNCTEPGGSSWAENGHCYFPKNDPSSWNVGRDRCVNAGAYLVTITSDAEQFFVSSLVGTTPRWIGLSKFGAPTFIWTNGEGAVSYAIRRINGSQRRFLNLIRRFANGNSYTLIVSVTTAESVSRPK
jgi:hypothetical protein